MMEYASIQNPWWWNPSSIEDDEKVRQALEKKNPCIPAFDHDGHVILIGPRQVGKSTSLKLWVRQLLKQGIKPRNLMYFSCEPLSTKQDLIDLVRAFDAETSSFEGKKYLFLDEIISINGWEQAVKFFVESSLSKNKQLVATGSNALLLKKGKDMLPGRNVDLKPFLPLSFREYLLHFGSNELITMLTQTKLMPVALSNPQTINDATSAILPFISEISSHLSVYFKTGGFLKAIYEYIDRGYILESTYEVYVRWIVGDVLKHSLRELTFRSVVKGVLKNYSSKYSILSLSKEMEIPSHVTAMQYLDFLEGIFLLNNLYQVDPNQRVAIPRKEKKTYFTDPFLYSAFSGYVAGKLQDFSVSHEDVLLEGMVCEALKRCIDAFFSSSTRLWFFAGKRETDFVVSVDDALIGIEVKFQNKVSGRDFSNFTTFKHRILLSKQDVDVIGTVPVIPVALFLALV